jgi:AcrR family transcriptional regulator
MASNDHSRLRPPQQARSQATLERLLQATEELIAQETFDKATIAEITRRSKSSVGAFYNRFADKEALFDCFDERFFQRAREYWDIFFASPQWCTGSPSQRVEQFVTFLVGKNREHRPLLRALALYGLTRPDARYLARRTQLEEHVLAQLEKGLVTFPGLGAHPNPTLAIALGVRMILSTVQALILFRDGPGETVPADEVLAAELTRAFLNYVGIPIPGDEKPGSQSTGEATSA